MNSLLNNETAETKQPRKAWRKKRRSMLDPFTTELLQMEQDKKTIPEMLDWLKERDVTASHNNLSHFLKNRREEREGRELTEQLNHDKNLYETVRKWIEANPNPKLEAVIERFKMLVLNLAMKKEADPELLKLADKLAQTAMRYENDRSRAEYRKHKLIMEREKHLEWVKCEQTRAFELCLDEAKKHPAVADMYRAAFDALRDATLKADDSTLPREKDSKTDLPATIPA